MAFRNRIINGDMRIDQRNAGAAVTPAAAIGAPYTLDRFRFFHTANSKITIQQTTDAPPGFNYSAKLTVASSYNPTLAEDQFFFGTSFECDTLGDFAFGTASAATAAVSFWIKSSVTGTYSLSWINSANNRSFVQTFTINSANTWERKTITVPGDTGGTWVNIGNARHSFIQIMLGNGSTLDTSTVGSWQAANVRATSGSVEFVAQANGSTMFITGFQLEKAAAATSFEVRPIGTELALCQRYFCKTYNLDVPPGATSAGAAGAIRITGDGVITYLSANWCYPVAMRANPTAKAYNPNTGATPGYSADANNLTTISVSPNQNNATYVLGNQSIGVNVFVSAHLTAEAEL